MMCFQKLLDIRCCPTAHRKKIWWQPERYNISPDWSLNRRVIQDQKHLRHHNSGVPPPVRPGSSPGWWSPGEEDSGLAAAPPGRDSGTTEGRKGWQVTGTFVKRDVRRGKAMEGVRVRGKVWVENKEWRKGKTRWGETRRGLLVCRQAAVAFIQPQLSLSLSLFPQLSLCAALLIWTLTIPSYLGSSSSRSVHLPGNKGRPEALPRHWLPLRPHLLMSAPATQKWLSCGMIKGGMRFGLKQAQRVCSDEA